MYNAMDVACAVVNYANEIGHPISNLKLQKILYFIQGYYMQKEGTPFFGENIEAWPYGPVIAKVYMQFQQFGSNFIPSTRYYTEITFDKIDTIKFKKIYYNEHIFSIYDLRFVKQVVKKLNKYSASQLVSITHAQKPWKDAIACGNKTIITKSSIRDYFVNRSKGIY